MKTLFLILLLTVTCYAQKIDGKKIDKWDAIARSQDEQTTFYYAPESIRRADDVIRVWTRFDFSNGSNFLVPGTDYASIRIFATFDCQRNSTVSEDILFYDYHGKLVKSGKDNSRVDETPSTFGYAIFEYLCERRSQFPNQPPKLKP